MPLIERPPTAAVVNKSSYCAKCKARAIWHASKTQCYWCANKIKESTIKSSQ